MRTSKKHADEKTVQRALEQFRGVVEKNGLRMTAVREAIVRAAMAQDGHFDVEHLVSELHRKDIDEASVATVYRAMPLLVQAGIVQPTMLSVGERHRYEAAFEREHHDHLVCTACGKVVEFHFEPFEKLQDELAAKYGFELTAHFHELLGRCADCKTQFS